MKTLKNVSGKLALILFIVIVFCNGGFAAGKFGIGYTSISLTSLTASGPQLVISPYDNVLLRISLYGYSYDDASDSTPDYIGAEIACLYNFPAIRDTKIIPQLGCSIAETNYWFDHSANGRSQYTFKLLMELEWFIYDNLSLNIAWPFFQSRWAYNQGLLAYTEYSVLGQSANAGITYYFW